jgi:TRAP-type C4-dicarboxylate transport system permease small subunit
MNDTPRPAPVDAPRPPLVSRLRATANTVLFIAAGLAVLGWVNLAVNVGHWERERLEHLSMAIAYIALIAVVAFIASFVLILIENRTRRDDEEGHA